MTQAVTHILVPLILVAVFRDFYLRKNSREKFPLHYVFIAGISGVIPDLDIAAFLLLRFFGFTFWEVHKTYLHSIFFPLIFFMLFVILYPVNLKSRICNIGKHQLKLSIIFLMASTGILSHLILDSIFGMPLNFLYPFELTLGLNLISYLPQDLKDLAMPVLDAALLIIYLIYLETKHKISDYI